MEVCIVNILTAKCQIIIEEEASWLKGSCSVCVDFFSSCSPFSPSSFSLINHLLFFYSSLTLSLSLCFTLPSHFFFSCIKNKASSSPSAYSLGFLENRISLWLVWKTRTQCGSIARFCTQGWVELRSQESLPQQLPVSPEILTERWINKVRPRSHKVISVYHTYILYLSSSFPLPYPIKTYW